MSIKRINAHRFEVIPATERSARAARRAGSGAAGGNGKLRGAMSAKSKAGANDYICAIERNQNGKYNVRVRVIFGGRGQCDWTLSVYFLASSFSGAIKKLEESLQLLQKNEERLRFWAVERTDDPNLAGDLLQEFGLWLDRRREYPRKIAELTISRARPVPASMLAPVRRILADSMAQERPAGVRDRAAVAGD